MQTQIPFFAKYKSMIILVFDVDTHQHITLLTKGKPRLGLADVYRYFVVNGSLPYHRHLAHGADSRYWFGTH